MGKRSCPAGGGIQRRCMRRVSGETGKEGRGRGGPGVAGGVDVVVADAPAVELCDDVLDGHRVGVGDRGQGPTAPGGGGWPPFKRRVPGRQAEGVLWCRWPMLNPGALGSSV